MTRNVIRILACIYLLYLKIATLEFCLTPFRPTSLSLPPPVFLTSNGKSLGMEEVGINFVTLKTSIIKIRWLLSHNYAILGNLGMQVCYYQVLKKWNSLVISWPKNFKTEASKLHFGIPNSRCTKIIKLQRGIADPTKLNAAWTVNVLLNLVLSPLVNNTMEFLPKVC